MKKLSHRATMLACYNGYITQAITINLAPLFYVLFQRNFSLSLGEIGFLIACNFATQLCVDFFASLFSDRMNLRFFAVLAHLIAVCGLFGLSVFPMIMPPYAGLLLAVGLLGVGGGFTEVIISPILEACPTTEKSGNMSFLHSFYSWGQAGVVLLSGLYFYLLDIDAYWKYLPWIWAIVPLAGAVAFSIVPIYRLPRAEELGTSKQRLFVSKTFLCFIVMMLCAGASEMTMSQWASDFAESALGIDKARGDLLGPGAFAVMMGSARVLYGKFSARVHLEAVMLGCCLLCIASYLLAALCTLPAFAFVGCALCGFSVGIFWPGILSCAAARLPGGGISMFALLALAGDVGCLIGPSAVGWIADALGGDLRAAFLFAALFPMICVWILIGQVRKRRKEDSKI